MNLLTWACPPRLAARPRRRAGPVLESVEQRLAPSPTLPLPPPHLASPIAEFYPPDPIIRETLFLPPDPCVRATAQ